MLTSAREILCFGALLGATTLLAACTSAPVPPPPTPTEPTGPSCPDSGIAITVEGDSGAMGLRALGIALTNCGNGDYTVNGYPVIRVLDADRRPLDVTVGHGSPPVSAPDSYDVPPEQVTLRPGDKASARILWRNKVTDSAVPATEGRYLEIAPAAGEPAQIVEPSGGIDLGTTSRLAVSPWAVRS